MADNQTLSFDPSKLIPLTGDYTSGATSPQPTIEQLQKLFGGAMPTTQTAQTSGSQQQNRGGKTPATIRYNNPGGQWDGPSASKFGSTTHGVITGGNHIAYFDTPEAGAAAQFDLLASPKYANRMIGPLIDDWSGGTGGKGNVSQYATNLAASIGRTPADPLTVELLKSPEGITLAKAQARWETGYDYPMSDDQWKAAQRMAFPDLANK